MASFTWAVSISVSLAVMVQVSVPHSGIVGLWYFRLPYSYTGWICLNLSLTLNRAWFHQSVVTIMGVFVLIQCLFFITAKKFSHLKKKKKMRIIAPSSLGCGNELVCIEYLD